jgi:hypothetical protein
LTSVDQLEVSVVDGVGDLGDGRVASVVVWSNVTAGTNELGTSQLVVISAYPA